MGATTARSSARLVSIEESCRALFHAFVVGVMPKFDFSDHHDVICRELMSLESRQIERLLIEAPPRHSKTLLTSTLFVAWYLGRNPTHEVILATYSQERADDLGKALRDVIRSEAYKAIFPSVALRRDSQSVSDLALESGGAIHAVGVGGALTGRGAHLMVIDDPIKDRKDADSPTMRRRLMDWYSSVASTRLYPDAVIVIMATRWHKDDLTGQILEADPRHALWKEIRMPAICDDAERDPVQRQYGAALWPKWFPVEKLNAIRNDPPGMIDRDWFALYQQRPVAETGDEFQRAWFEARWNDPLPVVLNMYGCSDFGVTEAGDPTEHGIFGIDPLYRIYVVDWWSGKATPDVWIERMLDLSQKWKVRRWFGEGGVIRHAVNPLLTRRMRERQVFVPLKWLNPIGNKTMRAQGFRGRAAAGTVLFPKRQWADAVIDQLCEFPAGKHDDKVDVCGMIGRVLDEIRNGREKRVEADGTDPTKDLKPFTAAWLEYEEKKPNDMRYC